MPQLSTGLDEPERRTMNTVAAASPRHPAGRSAAPRARQRSAAGSPSDDRLAAPCCLNQALRAADLMSTPRTPMPDPRSHAGQRAPRPPADELAVAITAGRCDHHPLSAGPTGRTIADLRRYVGPNDTLSRVLSVMRSSRLAELPVLDGRGVIVGVITAATLVEMLIQSEHQHHRPDRDSR